MLQLSMYSHSTNYPCELSDHHLNMRYCVHSFYYNTVTLNHTWCYTAFPVVESVAVLHLILITFSIYLVIFHFRQMFKMFIIIGISSNFIQEQLHIFRIITRIHQQQKYWVTLRKIINVQIPNFWMLMNVNILL